MVDSDKQQTVPASNDALAFVYDVPVMLQVMMGTATLTIGDILKCGKGSVIPLNQKVGDPFEIKLQNRTIAEGEVVEIDNRLGIKILKVINSDETAASQPGATPADGETPVKDEAQ